MSKQYPLHKLLRKKISKKIDLWTAHASHIVSGCEWVDYMTHWDTLTLGHFSISTQEKPRQERRQKQKKNTITILHAPNHRIMKGTDYVQRAVKEIADSGIDVRLIISEKKPNKLLMQQIYEADIVVDQLIVGWYAMFILKQ